MKDQLSEAELAVWALLTRRNERWHPTFHVAPTAGWMNDSNGLSFFNGRYHGYFQHHPNAAVPGLMHWGHASSADLIHWRHEPMALAPSIEEDRDGIFSGSVVIDESGGTLRAYYTGHRRRNGIDGADDNLEV